MPVELNTGRNPTAKELAEAKRIAALDKEGQRAFIRGNLMEISD